MAAIMSLNVYQINQTNVLPRNAPARLGFPTAGVLLRSCIDSPTRSLPSGYNVYGIVQVLATGDQYYVAETISQLVTIANA